MSIRLGARVRIRAGIIDSSWDFRTATIVGFSRASDEWLLKADGDVNDMYFEEKEIEEV